jgi:oxygen-dependent protoporphyrinogen oxidase
VGTLLGISGQPVFTSVARWPNAMPQYTVGHVKRLALIEDRTAGLPGLYLAGNWQAGVGVPDCIDSAERAVSRLMDRLGAKTEALLKPA